jgi:hypothetical protein
MPCRRKQAPAWYPFIAIQIVRYQGAVQPSLAGGSTCCISSAAHLVINIKDRCSLIIPIGIAAASVVSGGRSRTRQVLPPSPLGGCQRLCGGHGFVQYAVILHIERRRAGLQMGDGKVFKAEMSVFGRNMSGLAGLQQDIRLNVRLPEFTVLRTRLLDIWLSLFD